MKNLFFSLILVLTLKSTLKAQSSSVLSKGDWYKFSLSQKGVYKIDNEWLKSAGIDLSTVDPKRISIYGQSKGMLPQKIADSRALDLLENRIYVHGESDGKFNDTDYILFYANDANRLVSDASGFVSTQLNLYENKAYYFLHIKDSEALRIENKSEIIGDFPKITDYVANYSYEEEAQNLLSSGRERYSKEMNSNNATKLISVPIENLIQKGDLKVELTYLSSLLSERFTHEIQTYFGSDLLGKMEVTTRTIGIYDTVAYITTQLYSKPASSISTSNYSSPSLKIQVKGRGYFDKISINAVARMSMGTKSLFFNSKNRDTEDVSTFELSNATNKLKIWDITNAQKVSSLIVKNNSTKISFNDSTKEEKSYVAFYDEQALVPAFVSKIKNQDLHADLSPDYVIITHGDFLSAANRLADFRRTYDGFTMKVVNIQEVYHEFSSGKQDPTAIRDYFRFLYKNGNKKLKYALLLGKASLDYKNLDGYGDLFLPTYESRNSLHLVQSYASDDYFTLLGDDSGEWQESKAGDEMVEIGIGRIPATKLSQANTVVDKIINYHKNTKRNLGLWKTKVMFVADDADRNSHLEDAEDLANVLKTKSPFYNIKKVYLDAYDEEIINGHKKLPAVNATIKESIDNGVLVLNYNGHGGTNALAQESIINSEEIQSWDNKYKLPFFITGTCQFGRHDKPNLASVSRISGAEEILFKTNGGGVGILTTSRAVYQDANKSLLLAVMQHLLSERGSNPRVGDAFKNTKNDAREGENNRNFILLGDPALRLGSVDYSIVSDSINSKSPAVDTIKLKALETVNIKGSITLDNGQLNSDFNGTVIVQLIDKATPQLTQGHDSNPTTFAILDNALFRGKATVKNGLFSISFIIPKNINYEEGEAKITFYASNAEQNKDAIGFQKIILGGSSDDFEADIEGPEIRLAFNDTTFQSGDNVEPNALFLASIYDESGINISQTSLGQKLLVTLDEDKQIPMNDYYIATQDDFKRGSIEYPFSQLEKGNHRLVLKAWDAHNNPSEQEILFHVTDQLEIDIQELFNYPNPFRDRTTFSLKHNRAKEDLALTIRIFSSRGELVSTLTQEIERNDSKEEEVEWNLTSGANKLNTGIYIANCSLKSLKDGSQTTKSIKIFITNK